MKRMLTVLLAAGLLLHTGTCLPAAEASEIISGNEEFTYEIVDDHVEIRRCYRSVANLVIPEEIDYLPVTVIGESAFRDNTALDRIVIPETVTEIGAWAFRGCEYLQELQLPEHLKKIGDFAFSDCPLLKEITIPESVTEIPAETFSGCYALSSVTLPSKLRSIGAFAFADCVHLTSLTLPETLESIGHGAFMSCNKLSELTLPESIVSLGDHVFTNTAVQNVVLPKGMKAIGDQAFLECSELVSITIPESVTSIGKYAFNGCTSLQEIVIPEGVKSIGAGAFQECLNLKSVQLPDGLQSIGSYAFQNCTRLSSVYVPDSVMDIGMYAFYCCEQLTELHLPESLREISECLVMGDALLETVNIPQKVTFIGSYAFGETLIKEAVIPETCMTLDMGAFMNCKQLESVTFMNPYCDFYDYDGTTICNEFDYNTGYYKYSGVIIGYEGSDAEKYARQYDIQFEKLPGEFPQPYAWGDLNNDGLLTVSDAILLARIVAEDPTLRPNTQMIAAADLDYDYTPTSDDTVIMLKVLAGKYDDSVWRTFDEKNKYYSALPDSSPAVFRGI